MKKFTVLRVERVKHCIGSARELAERAGVTEGRVKLFEAQCGQRRYLKADELARLAEVLGVPVETIADERGLPVMAAV